MDETLLARYLAGDEKAFEELLERHLGGVYSFVAQYVGSAEEAEDITQEAFFKVWKNLKKFDPKKASFKTWCMRIVRNSAVDFLRKKKSVPFSQFENEEGENLLEEGLAAPEPSAEEDFLKREQAQVVQHAIQHLPLHQREILLLYLQNDMTFVEIGRTLDASVNTVKSRYRRALLALKDALHQRNY